MSESGPSSLSPGEHQPVAPRFIVQATKSHKPSEKQASTEGLLSFKRKQLIVVKDWDENSDAIFGEFDGKSGWLPSSFVKLIGTSDSQATPRTLVQESDSLDGPISIAAAKRNSIPIQAGRNRQASAPVRVAVNPTQSFKHPVSPSNGPPSLEASKSVLGTIINVALPKLATSNKVPDSNINNSLKNVKFFDANGVPAIISVITDHCRKMSTQEDMKDLLCGVGSESKIVALKELFDKVEQPDLSGFSNQTIVSTLKSFLCTISEPLIPLELYLSFVAAADIEDSERRTAQFSFLLELVPQQSFNIISHLCHFFRECVEKHEKLTILSVSRIFGQSFCRKHGLSAIDENERLKSIEVTKILIGESNQLFKETLNINDKKAEKARDNKRRREKESMATYSKSEHKRAKKIVRQKEKENKKRKDSDFGEASPDDELTVGSFTGDSGEDIMSDRLAHRRANSIDGRNMEVKKPKLANSLDTVVLRNLQEQSKVIETKDQSPTSANSASSFYRLAFFGLLVLFILSHLVRSLL